MLESLFNKVAGLRPATLLTPAQVFFFKICEIYKTTFFEEHLRLAASPCIYSWIGQSDFCKSRTYQRLQS